MARTTLAAAAALVLLGLCLAVVVRVEAFQGGGAAVWAGARPGTVAAVTPTRRAPAAARRLPPLAAYEPTPVDPVIIYRQLAVMGISAGAAAVWWNVLVPAKRTELALDKKDGELNTYLEDLRESNAEADGKLTEGDRKLERWLLADWMSPGTTKKAAALPFLPKAKFNSGDNPILAAGALIMGTGVVFSLLGWT